MSQVWLDIKGALQVLDNYNAGRSRYGGSEKAKENLKDATQNSCEVQKVNRLEGEITTLSWTT